MDYADLSLQREQGGEKEFYPTDCLEEIVLLNHAKRVV